MKNTKKIPLLKKIKIYISNLWFKYVKNPFYLQPKIKKEAEKRKKTLIKNFEEKQKTAVSRIKDIMYHENVYNENNPKTNYFNEKLIEGRKRVNEMSAFTQRTPFLYDPDICDIHNETIHEKKDTIDKIILEEDNFSKKLLKKQEIKLNRLSNNKNKKNIFTSEKKDVLNNSGDTENIVSLNQLREWDSEENKQKHEKFIKDLNSLLKK
jgi:hypothetical protein